MDKTIQKNINLFFYSLDEHVKKWIELFDKVKRPMIGLRNQVEQLVHVEKIVLDSDMAKFPDLKERLLFKILYGIDGELIILKNIITEMNVASEELHNKLVAFEKSTNNFDWCSNDFSSGNAFQPRISDLLQMALESWRYFSDMYQNISRAFKTLDVRNDMSLKKLGDSFQMKIGVKDRITYILALTQYCNNTHI